MLPSSTDLIYFYEVVNESHFSRAAKKLNVSQPSLSLAIKRLEVLLGTTLLIRHKQGVGVTRSGAELFRNVEKLLSVWQKTLSSCKDVRDNVEGEVIIGCYSALAPFMSNLVSKLLAQYPNLEIHFQLELNGKNMENLVKGQIDIAIVTDPYPHADVIIQQISHTEFTLWESTHTLSTLDWQAKDTVFICDPKLSQTQYLINDILKITKHNRLRLNTLNQIEAIAAMTAEGYGIGILPVSFAERYFGDKLKRIHSAPLNKLPLCLVYRSENKDINAVRVVLNALKELANNHNQVQNKLVKNCEAQVMK